MYRVLFLRMTENGSYPSKIRWRKGCSLARVIIESMLSRRRTGFHVHIGERIWPEYETALGNLVKYIVRASFSRKRMVYILVEKSADGSAKVAYTSKGGRTEQTFDTLDWLARLVVNIPNRYEQLVRYVGYPLSDVPIIESYCRMGGYTFSCLRMGKGVDIRVERLFRIVFEKNILIRLSACVMADPNGYFQIHALEKSKELVGGKTAEMTV